MAWWQNPSETRTEEFRSWQVVVGGYGNQATQDGLLKLQCDTCDIYSIELIEIRYFPNAAEVGDIRVIGVFWKEDSRLNDENKNFRFLAPNLLADGSYIGEYNVPRNLYKFNGSNHRHTTQNFELSIKKSISGQPLNTDYILCTLRVTAKNVGGDMIYAPGLERVILNDRT